MLGKVFTPTIVSDEEFRLIMFALAPMYVADGEPVDLDRILANSQRTVYRAKVHNDLFADHSYDVVDQLAAIRAPTLVMCGALDWICPPEQSRLIASRIPRAKLGVVRGSVQAIPAATALAELYGFLAGAGPGR
jgi:proline iminopeptidase